MTVMPPATAVVGTPDHDDSRVAAPGLLLATMRSARASLAAQYEAIAIDLLGDSDPDGARQREVAEIAAARARQEVAAIDAALARVEAGIYGRCVDCGATIPIERLEVVPHARSCVDCTGTRGRSVMS